MKKRELLSNAGAALGLAVVLLVGGTTGATAADESRYDTPDVRDFYTKYGVDEATQDRLIASMEEGDLIDALSSGEEPVSAEEILRDGVIEVVYTYQDGSVAVTSLENPEPLLPGSISPRAVSGCTINSGSGYVTATNCLVNHTAAYASLSFRANYQRYASATGGSISPRYGTDVISSTIGSISSQSLTLVRANSTATEPAVATLYGYLSGGVFSEDLYLSLRVSGSAAWTTTY